MVLNRPERLNALTWEMRQQLREHFSELRFNDAVRAIIVTGEGRAFCTGADVGGMERKDLHGEREKLQQGSHSYMRVLTAIEKPVIAAVRGPTVGIGWSIAMGCDLIVASETARFSQIFRRIGLAPGRRGNLGFWSKQRIGMARAKELVFTGRFVDAARGIVARPGQLRRAGRRTWMAKAEELAADLAAGPTFAFGMAKKMFAMANSTYEDFLDLESLVQPQLGQTDDHRRKVLRSVQGKARAKIQGALIRTTGEGMLSIITLMQAGLPLANARSTAPGKSPMLVTNSPWPPTAATTRS